MVIEISAEAAARLDACRLAFNSFTKSKLTIDQYISEVLIDAVSREEAIALISRGIKPAGVRHVH